MFEYPIDNSLSELERCCERLIKERMVHDAAHDLAHIKRVVNSARQLALSEGASLAIVVPAAWLHDLVNYPKNHPKRAFASIESSEHAHAFLKSIGVPDANIVAIQHAICAHSFSANIVPQTIEAKVVQDADRLDAIGAIGIARCMMVGGQLNRVLYELDDPFCGMREPDDRSFTLDHFYQKLLCLESSFQTESARHEASQRTQFMHTFLQQLRRELP